MTPPAAWNPSTPGQDEDRELFAAFAAVLASISAALESMGVQATDVVALIRTLRSALHGFVSLEATGGFGLPESVGASFDVLVDTVIAGIRDRAEHPRPTP